MAYKLSNTEKAAYERDGYIIVANMFDTEEVDRGQRLHDEQVGPLDLVGRGHPLESLEPPAGEGREVFGDLLETIGQFSTLPLQRRKMLAVELHGAQRLSEFVVGCLGRDRCPRVARALLFLSHRVTSFP